MLSDETAAIVNSRPVWLMKKTRDTLQDERQKAAILLAICGCGVAMNQAALVLSLAEECLWEHGYTW